MFVGVADAEDLGGESEEIAGDRVEGQTIVTLEPASAAVADRPEGCDLEARIAEFGGIGDVENDAGRVEHALTCAEVMGLEDEIFCDERVVDQMECPFVIGPLGESIEE